MQWPLITTLSTAQADAGQNTFVSTRACRSWFAIFTESGKPIFTICHGVQILIAVDGVVSGREVAALQYCEPEVKLAGGTYIDVPPTGAHAHGNLVSAKGWPGLAAFMAECLRVLGTQITHGAVLSAKPADLDTPQPVVRGKKEKRRAEAA